MHLNPLKIRNSNPIPKPKGAADAVPYKHDGGREPEQQLRLEIRELTHRIESLQNIQNDYREIVEHATEMIFRLDTAGNFIFVSAEFERVLSFSAEEMGGRHFTSIVHPDDIGLCMENFQTLAAFGKADGNIIFRVRRKDEQYIWVNCSGVCLFDDNGNPVHIIGFAHDITRLQELVDSLRAAQEENTRNQALLAVENERYIEATKTIARAVVDAQEKERAEIGIELHDNVNQILSTARLHLELARTDEEERLNLIEKSINGIRSAVKEIRKISKSLVPPSVGDLGLIASIDDLLDDVRATGKLSVEFYHQGDIENDLTDKVKLTLFRIVQEQVTNILKHSGATKMVIELIMDGKALQMSIGDNGCGFDIESVRKNKGVGLKNINSRVELFNGNISMVAAPGKGCTLNITIPF